MTLKYDVNPKRVIICKQNQINFATIWFKNWRLIINAQRTIGILFSTPKNNYTQIQLNGHNEEQSTFAKHLGVYLDCCLFFSKLSAETIAKTTKIRYILYPILNRTTPIPINIKNVLQHTQDQVRLGQVRFYK